MSETDNEAGKSQGQGLVRAGQTAAEARGAGGGERPAEPGRPKITTWSRPGPHAEPPAAPPAPKTHRPRPATLLDKAGPEDIGTPEDMGAPFMGAIESSFDEPRKAPSSTRTEDFSGARSPFASPFRGERAPLFEPVVSRAPATARPSAAEKPAAAARPSASPEPVAVKPVVAVEHPTVEEPVAIITPGISVEQASPADSPAAKVTASSEPFTVKPIAAVDVSALDEPAPPLKPDVSVEQAAPAAPVETAAAPAAPAAEAPPSEPAAKSVAGLASRAAALVRERRREAVIGMSVVALCGIGAILWLFVPAGQPSPAMEASLPARTVERAVVSTEVQPAPALAPNEAKPPVDGSQAVASQTVASQAAASQAATSQTAASQATEPQGAPVAVPVLDRGEAASIPEPARDDPGPIGGRDERMHASLPDDSHADGPAERLRGSGGAELEPARVPEGAPVSEAALSRDADFQADAPGGRTLERRPAEARSPETRASEAAGAVLPQTVSAAEQVKQGVKMAGAEGLNNPEARVKAALNYGKTAKDKRLVAAASARLGALLFKRQEWEDSEVALKQSLALYEELAAADPALKDDVARTSNALGQLYRERLQFDKAEKLHNDAIAIDGELGRKAELAGDYTYLGLLNQARKRFEPAEQAYMKAMDIYKDLNSNEGMAKTYSNLGEIYFMRESLDKAAEMFKKAIALENADRLNESAAIEYSNLGVVYAKRREYGAACASWRKARRLMQDANMKAQLERVQRALRSRQCMQESGYTPHGWRGVWRWVTTGGKSR